jgi:uncharacterized protein YndB with AHSA1/START domain
MTTETSELVVRKSVTVAAPPERAFEVFTNRISNWWPFEGHSIGGESVEAAVIEGREGGRFYERQLNGTEENWATMTVWEPPHRLAFSWTITQPATEVEVRFIPEGDGTRVELEHRGFERLAEAETRRGNYDRGWGKIMERYAEAMEGAA